MSCDFCGNPCRELIAVSDTFEKFLPKKYLNMCAECGEKINNFLWKRRVFHMDNAWRETAVYAIELGKNDLRIPHYKGDK